MSEVLQTQRNLEELV